MAPSIMVSSDAVGAARYHRGAVSLQYQHPIIENIP
jgi:hypothetical protein